MLVRHAVLVLSALLLEVACDGSSPAPPPPPPPPQQRTVTVTLRFDGGGSGSVVSDPAGLRCSGDTCVGTFDLATRITLEAVVDGTPWVGWGGDCNGHGTTCQLVVMRDLDVQAVFLGANYAFVTSTRYDIDGLSAANADAACNERAAAAGLPGTYVTWRASAGQNAVARLGTARGWVRPDGLPIADTAGDLVGGGILYPPDVTELGDAFVGNALTGTAADGELAEDCDGWTGATQDGYMTIGDPSAALGAWTDAAGLTCDGSGPIYCFGVDVASPVSPRPASGRVAFVSAGALDGAAGLEGFDALCAAEASDAGLPGTYRAFLATSSSSAASRFDLAGAPWVRPDGLQVTASAADVTMSEEVLLAPVLLHADGSVATDTRAWTGTHDGGGGGTSTCSDWSSSLVGARGAFGYVTSGQSWLGMMDTSCSDALPVYCFQE